MKKLVALLLLFILCFSCSLSIAEEDKTKYTFDDFFLFTANTDTVEIKEKESGSVFLTYFPIPGDSKVKVQISWNESGNDLMADILALIDLEESAEKAYWKIQKIDVDNVFVNGPSQGYCSGKECWYYSTTVFLNGYYPLNTVKYFCPAEGGYYIVVVSYPLDPEHSGVSVDNTLYQDLYWRN